MPTKSASHTSEKISLGVRKPHQPARASHHQAPQVNPADAVARAQALPASELSASDILALQRTAGNRAVARLLAQQLQAEKTSSPRRRSLIIQARLAVGPANDTYEREADRVAATVMQTPESSPAHVQRSLSQEEDQDEIVQAKPLASSITPLIQRQETTEEETDDDDDTGDVVIQRRIGGDLASIEPGVERGIEQARGGGEALPGELRDRMEQAFGASFSGVRVHADSKADTLNRSLQSRAFTTGQHLFFRRGEYNPNSQRGRELLAHELTHVVQQAGGTTSTAMLRNKVSITPSDADIVQRATIPYPENDDELAAYEFGADPEFYYGLPPAADYYTDNQVDQPQGPGRLSRMGSAIASGARSLGGGIARGASWAGRGIVRGAQAAGRGIDLLGQVGTEVTREVGRTIVTGAQATGRGALWLGEQAVAGARATGRGIAAGARAVGRGAVWLGEQAVAGARATGRGIGAGARAVGRGAVWLGEQAAAGARAVGRGAVWLGEQAMAGARATGRGIAAGATAAGRGIVAGTRAAGAGLSWLGGKIAQGAGWLGRGARDTASWLGSTFLGGHWGGSSTDQQVQHVGSRMSAASGVATAGGGIGSLISTSLVRGADERILHPTLQQADLSLRGEGGTQTFSQVGQGFGSASGIASGLGGLVSMGSGLQNIGAEKRWSGRWFRRGIGRTTSGAGQVFAGMAAAGKGISAMTGATTAGAQFMTAAALPAAIAMGGVDVLKGGWGTYKAYKSRQALERKKEQFNTWGRFLGQAVADPSLAKMASFAEFAKEYQGKRMGRKVVGMVSGALGIAGGAMMLTGVGLLPGAIVAGLGGLIKVGSGLYGMLRDKYKGKEFAEKKKQSEQEMAEFASTMLTDRVHGKDMEEMLVSIGMEEKILATMKTMAPEQRKPFILAQLMRR